MSRIPPIFSIARLASLGAAACLAACSSSSMPGSGITTPPPTSTPTAAAFQAHAGLEIMTDVGGPTAVGSIASAPSVTITDTPTGFTLSYASSLDGSVRTVTFDTPRVAGAGTNVGCSKCTGSSFGLDKVYLTFVTSDLNYTTYGSWQTAAFPISYGPSGVFATGQLTAVSDRPTTGAATYIGVVKGYIGTMDYKLHTLTGKVTLTADFAGNSIAGAISNIATVTETIVGTSFETGAMGSSNDIALTAGTITGVNFSGAAAAVSTTPGVTINTSGGSGTFGGAFYGPKAAEAGGSVRLTGPSTVLIASFGAKK